MTCEAKLLTTKELEEAMEPLSADAESRVCGHIAALSAEMDKARAVLAGYLGRPLMDKDTLLVLAEGAVARGNTSEDELAKAESERDAAKDGWRVESARLAGTRDELRECVSTVERERTAAGETELDLLKSIEALHCTLDGVQEGATEREWGLVAAGVERIATAEARVKELTERLARAEQTELSLRNTISGALASQPPTAPAQVPVESAPDVSALGPDYARGFADGWGKRGARIRAQFDARAEAAAPTTPALVDAVRLASAGLREGLARTADDSSEEAVNDALGDCREALFRLDVALAAYDAAKGGRPEHPTSGHAQSVVTQLESLLVDVGEGVTGRRDVVGRVRLVLEDAAKYRAALGLLRELNTYIDFAEPWEPGDYGVKDPSGINDVFGRILTMIDGMPPAAPRETLDKARVVEVLRAKHDSAEDVASVSEDADSDTHAQQVDLIRETVESIAEDLGLTLDVGGGK